VLITLASALKNAGYDVIDADNGDDAILLARQHRPDLALLDIRMDGKSGLDVASYLRDYVGTPFMFLSAFSDDAFIAKAREFGALDYLVKPIDIELIAPAVAQAMRAARERESRSPMVPGQPAPVSHEDSEAVRCGGRHPDGALSPDRDGRTAADGAGPAGLTAGKSVRAGTRAQHRLDQRRG
jgi:response regulator NasT